MKKFCTSLGTSSPGKYNNLGKMPGAGFPPWPSKTSLLGIGDLSTDIL